MNRITALLVTSLFSSLLAAQEKPPEGPSPTIKDFMVMDVCVDAGDKLIPGMLPLDPACKRHRDIRPGEAAPYSLHNHLGPSKGCLSRLGNVAKENVPVAMGKVVRIVSSYDKGRSEDCAKEGTGNQKFGDFDADQEGASIQWFDDQYAFILGSWSPVTEAHWVTPNCRQFPTDSRRFYRGWIIGSVDGKAGSVTTESKVVLSTPKENDTQCPPRYSRSFTHWVPGVMTFTSGAKLSTIVSSHYSRASASGQSPGAAEQLERTYWTREYGFLRWEKWARKTWIHPRNKKPAEQMARSLQDSGRCSPPIAAAGAVTKEFSSQTVASGQNFYVEHQVVAGSPGVDWVMTACNDFSKPVLRADGQQGIDWAKSLNPVYWR